MKDFSQRILKGLGVLKDSPLFFISICLVSVFVIYIIPSITALLISEKDLNEGIVQVGNTYGGMMVFSAEEIMASIVYFFRFSIISTIALVVAYTVKYSKDKRIFKINKWRDWRFFIYASGISLVVVDLTQKVIMGSGDDLMINMVMTVLSVLLIVLSSSILLPEELREIRIAEIDDSQA